VPGSSRYDATVFRPLYELVSAGYTTWTFSPANVEVRASELVQAIEDIAVLFMQSLATMHASRTRWSRGRSAT
jgi:hypothetical protein